MLEGFSGRLKVHRERFPPMPYCAKRRLYIEYLTGGSKAIPVIDDTNIIGFEAKVTPSRREWGSIYNYYIPGDMMRTAHDRPQVQ